MSADERTEVLPTVEADGEPATPVPGEGAGDGHGPRPVSRRKWLIGAVVVGGLAITAGGIAYTWVHADSGGPAATGPSGGQTIAVERTDLSQQKSMSGTLGFGAPETVKGRASGTVTWLPKPGDTLDRGGQLARVNDQPVTVFRGSMPLYRTLGAPAPQAGDGGSGPSTPSASPGSSPGGTTKPGAHQAANPTGKGSPGGTGTAPGTTGSAPTGGDTTSDQVAGPGTKGADVKLLEENLYALGYHDFGRPDDTLTDATVTAIKRWQKHMGVQQTGRVAPGDVQVLPGKVRVGDVKAHLGDSAASDLMVVTGTDRVVTVPMSVSDLSLAGDGSKVSITLPGGTTAKGEVASVGTVAGGAAGGQGGPGDGKASQDGATQEAKVPVTVTLDDSPEAARLDGAQVTVEFASEVHKGVLAVPVGALVALREGGYALQLPAAAGAKPQLVPVTTGMFAKGLVEVSGADIKEGMKVVTTT
ncbi:peptidoglycan-binding protein [Streptomyces gamaensis]|uniref:Peptidoglycan-binding protein n=1 Tax=Streptomyces gamaensis TaxID=1763542 RepID=A0ABW0Z794_9ACTN